MVGKQLFFNPIISKCTLSFTSSFIKGSTLISWFKSIATDFCSSSRLPHYPKPFLIQELVLLAIFLVNRPSFETTLYATYTVVRQMKNKYTHTNMWCQVTVLLVALHPTYKTAEALLLKAVGCRSWRNLIMAPLPPTASRTERMYDVLSDLRNAWPPAKHKFVSEVVPIVPLTFNYRLPCRSFLSPKLPKVRDFSTHVSLSTGRVVPRWLRNKNDADTSFTEISFATGFVPTFFCGT
jgi:hypothetical protein